MPPRQGQAVIDSGIFDDEIMLALLAVKSAGRESGLLRIGLAAAPTNPRQEAEMVEIDRMVPGENILWRLPNEQAGFPIGERWFPAGEEVLAPIPIRADLEERLEEFGRQCQPFFDRILFGDPATEAGRLLSSIPGFGHELRDDP